MTSVSLTEGAGSSLKSRSNIIKEIKLYLILILKNWRPKNVGIFVLKKEKC